MRIPSGEQLGKTAGFTLIEVVLVVLIIGIIVSMAGLSITQSGNDRLLAEEAKRVAGLMNLLSQEATISGKQYAVRIHQDGYEFWWFDKGDWLPIEAGSTFGPRQWSAPFQTALEVEGERIEIPFKESSEPAPQIYFLSSGEMSAYRMILALSNTQGQSVPPWLIEGNYIGKSRIRELKDDEWLPLLSH